MNASKGAAQAVGLNDDDPRALLAEQVQILDAAFRVLMRRALGPDDGSRESSRRMALKVQAQCRESIRVLNTVCRADGEEANATDEEAMRSAFAQVQAFLVEHRGQFIDREGHQSEVPLRMLGDRLEDVDGVRWSRLTVAAWHLACEGWRPGTKRFDSRIVARVAVAAGMVRPAFSGAPYQMTGIPPLGRVAAYIVREGVVFGESILASATGTE